MPKVSVIVPNYNYEAYLSLRLDSIINQTFQDLEIIILDDKSTDNSKAVIEQYRNHLKVSHIVYNEVNSGSPFVQWNRGVELAQGEWIWIAEADDLADIRLLEILVKNAEKEDNVVLSYCQSYRMDAERKTTGDWSDWTQDLDESYFNEDFVLDGNTYIQKFLHNKNTIPNASGVIFKKETFVNVGMADIDVRYCGDWFLWLKMLSIGKVAFCAEKLNYFRYHNKSVIASSSVTSDSLFHYKYDIYLRNKFIEFLNNRFCIKGNETINQEIIEIFRKTYSNECEWEAQYLKKNGLKKQAINYMFYALKYSYNKKRVFYRLVFDYLFSSKNRIKG